jgi:hypothetical protein
LPFRQALETLRVRFAISHGFGSTNDSVMFLDENDGGHGVRVAKAAPEKES